MSDEDAVRAYCQSADTPTREALDRVLARLQAAEKVCANIAGFYKVKKQKPSNWIDTAVLVQNWERIRPDSDAHD